MHETATPAVRLSYLLDQFPDRNTRLSICQTDFGDALDKVAELLAALFESACIQGNLADRDPNTSGVQPDCQVSYVQRLGEPDQEETPIRRCDLDGTGAPAAGQTLPCWYVRPDPETCGSTSTQLSLEVERDVDPPPDTSVLAYCVVD